METILTRLLADMPQSRRILKLLFIGLGLLLIGAIAALLPIDGLNRHHADKFLHIAVFFGFAAVLDRLSQRSFWFVKVPLLLFYGAFIEVVQALSPWRSLSLADFLADVVGIMLYWVLWRQILKRLISYFKGRDYFDSSSS
jgi:hypothetical protein